MKLRHLRNVSLIIIVVSSSYFGINWLNNNFSQVQLPVYIEYILASVFSFVSYCERLLGFIGVHNPIFSCLILSTLFVVAYFLILEKVPESSVLPTSPTSQDSGDSVLALGIIAAAIVGSVFILGFAILFWGLGSGKSSWPLWFAGLISFSLVGGAIAVISSMEKDKKTPKK